MPCSWIAKAKSHYLGVARGHAGLTRKGSCHRDGGHRRRGGGGQVVPLSCVSRCASHSIRVQHNLNIGSSCSSMLVMAVTPKRLAALTSAREELAK